MKALLLVDDLDNGGLERQMALLATSLPATWQSRVWAMRRGPFERYLRERLVPVTVCERRSRFDVSVALSLWKEIHSLRPDVVHSWSWMCTAAAGPACRLLGIPLVDGTIQTGVLQPEFLCVKRFGMRCATLIVANSYAGLRAWGVGPAKGRVVQNGFDASRLARLEHKSDRASDRFSVIMTGRMVPVKDYDVVVRAARLLAVRSEGWRFILLGNGPDRDRLMHESRDLVEDGVIEFPAPGIEVLARVAEADAGVLMTNPSYGREGISNSIVEYMASGLPVVCSDGGGSPEVVVNGSTGFLVPPRDAEALAERLAHLRDNEALRKALGAAGRRRVIESFSVERMVADMIRAYEEARGGPR